jgi:cyclophilin family peptidyl-prolyl cis-trans isomerase/HEAT repeat protein
VKYLLITLVFISVVACQRTSLNSFVDAEVATIYSLQDRRQTDSLLLYLSHSNNNYRTQAALAFASVQDTAAANMLGILLTRDAETPVRVAAAYALGQTPCSESERVLMTVSNSEKASIVLREVLESLGKVVSTKNALALANFIPADTLAEQGKAWGLYRLGLRRITDSTVVAAAYALLGSQNTSTRLAVAHFFARTSLQEFSDDKGLLSNAASDKNVFVRMAATSGLRNVKTDAARMLVQKNAADVDERVRISALRALRSFAFADVQETFFIALNDASKQVQVAAAEALNGFATVAATTTLTETASRAANWRVQATLYEVAASLSPSPSLFQSIQAAYNASTNAYQKAALLSVLGRSATNATFIGNALIDNSDPILLSSAALSLTACNSASDFSEKEKPVFLQWYKMAIEKGDAAVTGIIAQVLGDSTKDYKSLIKDVSFLKEARNKLTLPKDNESIQPVETALAYLEGREADPVENDFNHPIDWALVKEIDQNQKATIKTTQGDITLELLVNEAPGSVANFVMLARQHYFDGKFFHRVVPNFVIQAGCNRGDGFGSEDYSIRSEFGRRRYTTGSVGMASAGKDTEGTQWFITHSPTPHLDGRYTIFAEVRSGMEVVNAIEVGDKILEVVLE